PGLKDPTLPSAAAAGTAAADAAAAASSAADTLATIASQRAALQPVPQHTAATQAADRPATAATTDAAKAGPDLAASLKTAIAGQQGGGASGGGQSAGQQGTAGQQHKAPLQPGEATGARSPLAPAADTAAAAAPTSASQFAAALRAAEPAATEAAPADTAASTLAAAGTMAAGPAPTSSGLSPATSLPVAPPVGDGQWPQALSQQMVRLSTQGNHTAELQLNPPDLGPLKVVLSVVNDQAQAQFVSPHAAVRAAVEAALPHLRSAMADSGIQLGQASVGADSFAGQPGSGQPQQQRQPGSQQTAFGAPAGSQPAPAGAVAAPARTLARGEVDTFA
ncbi:flagellar hook-length control protein FliK, partial [Cupriavidus sp. WS]|uniref:flagellar hook-length control protein FliK n=1 Tax=Cupriavidus sp. WS TaxID=1312922 RepID=UPI000373AE66